MTGGQSDLAAMVLHLTGPATGPAGSSGSGGGLGGARVVGSSDARVAHSASLACWLEPGERYLVLPLGFNHHAAAEARPFALALFSSRPLAALLTYRLPPEAGRHAAVRYATDPSRSTTTHWHGAEITTRSGGALLLAHVLVPRPRGADRGTAVQVQVAVNKARNMVHGRAGPGGSAGGVPHDGSFQTTDTVHPGSQQLLVVAAPVAAEYGYGVSYKYKTVPTAGSRQFVLSLGGDGGPRTDHSPPVGVPGALFAPHSSGR